MIGLRIIREDGGSPGLGRGFVRWLIPAVMNFIPFGGLVSLISYLWPIWDPKKQTWHDKAAGTVVVRR